MEHNEAIKFTELIQLYADTYHMLRKAEKDNYISFSEVDKLQYKVDDIKEQIWKWLEDEDEEV